MEIQISASSLKDFMVCKRLYWFRRNLNYEKISTKEQVIGSIVHTIIGDADNLDSAIAQLKNTYNHRSDDNTALNFLENYYNYIHPKLNNDKYKKEISFKTKYKGCYLVGRFDRIELLKDAVFLYDWKTSSRHPQFFNLHDIQFYFYWKVLGLLYPRQKVTLIYGELNNGTLHTLDISKELCYNIDMEIDSMIEFLRENGQEKDVLSRHIAYHCSYCPFKHVCKQDLENERNY